MKLFGQPIGQFMYVMTSSTLISLHNKRYRE